MKTLAYAIQDLRNKVSVIDRTLQQYTALRIAALREGDRFESEKYKNVTELLNTDLCKATAKLSQAERIYWFSKEVGVSTDILG